MTHHSRTGPDLAQELQSLHLVLDIAEYVGVLLV